MIEISFEIGSGNVSVSVSVSGNGNIKWIGRGLLNASATNVR